MTSLLAVLFFAATGVTLNHPDWLAGESTRDFTLHRGRNAGCALLLMLVNLAT